MRPRARRGAGHARTGPRSRRPLIHMCRRCLPRRPSNRRVHFAEALARGTSQPQEIATHRGVGHCPRDDLTYVHLLQEAPRPCPRLRRLRPPETRSRSLSAMARPPPPRTHDRDQRGGSGHPTSCMSCAELVSVLFFQFLKFDVRDPDSPHNDRFVLSKGRRRAHPLRRCSPRRVLFPRTNWPI